MSYPANALFDIETLVNAAQPASILLLGGQSREFLDQYVEQKALINQLCSVTHIPVDEIASLNQIQQCFDVGIALDLFEHIDKQQGSQILSRLRDVLTAQYCVCLPIAKTTDAASWQLSEMFGFALNRVASYTHNGSEYGLFKYNIAEYKKTPEWLNADNWANPKMWDKYWW